MFGFGVYMEFTPAGGNGGNQQIVLSAKTGFPRFSDVHSNGSADAQPVSYSIVKDSDGTPVETGVGYLSGTTGGDQLERVKPEATWNGTTYTKLPSSRATLADGTLYRVYCAHSVNVHALGYRGVLNLSNQLQAPLNTVNPGTTGVSFGNPTRLCAWAWFLAETAEFDGFVFRPGAATNVDIGLYRVRADGDPGELIIGVTSFAMSSAVLNTATFTPTKLDAGWYYLAMCCDTFSTSFWQETVALGALSSVAGGYNYQAFRKDYTFGTLPNPFGTPTSRGYNPNGSNTVIPQVRLRRA